MRDPNLFQVLIQDRESFRGHRRKQAIAPLVVVRRFGQNKPPDFPEGSVTAPKVQHTKLARSVDRRFSFRLFQVPAELRK